jgi:3,4-dihydroxy 2-butanone 4-phosphate synthase/GTP cyclohydrolase II
MSPEIIDRLETPDIVRHNSSLMGTAFTVFIDAVTGMATGISAVDRARTIRVAVDLASRPEDLVVPGHMFPLRAKLGGVLERSGHTEAAVDLARLVGLKPAGAICEIINADGTMAHAPELGQPADMHRLKLVSVTHIVDYRRNH